MHRKGQVVSKGFSGGIFGVRLGGVGNSQIGIEKGWGRARQAEAVESHSTFELRHRVIFSRFLNGSTEATTFTASKLCTLGGQGRICMWLIGFLWWRHFDQSLRASSSKAPTDLGRVCYLATDSSLPLPTHSPASDHSPH